MKKPKIFIACDTTSLVRVKKIINQSKTTKIKIGYKFGLEFMNSEKGRKFLSTLKNKIIFVDLKLNDTVNTMISTVKALRDLKIHYLTVHISSGLTALKAVKKVSRSTKIIGVTAAMPGGTGLDILGAIIPGAGAGIEALGAIAQGVGSIADTIDTHNKDEAATTDAQNDVNNIESQRKAQLDALPQMKVQSVPVSTMASAGLVGTVAQHTASVTGGGTF